MLKWGKIWLPSACLIVAVAVLFGRPFILGYSPLPEPSPNSVSGPPVRDNEPITLHYHERPPFFETTATGVHGLYADPVNRVFTQAGIPFRWQLTPAQRQLEILQENRAAECAVGWFKNSQREQFARYSLPIYQDKPLLALARSDNHLITSGRSLRSVLADPKLVLLRKEGYSYGSYLDEQIARLKPKQIATKAENVSVLHMIYTGRADYFFLPEEEADPLIAISGLSKTAFKPVRFSDMPDGNSRHILFNKRVAPQVIEAVNAMIKVHLPDVAPAETDE